MAGAEEKYGTEEPLETGQAAPPGEAAKTKQMRNDDTAGSSGGMAGWQLGLLSCLCFWLVSLAIAGIVLLPGRNPTITVRRWNFYSSRNRVRAKITNSRLYMQDYKRLRMKLYLQVPAGTPQYPWQASSSRIFVAKAKKSSAFVVPPTTDVRSGGVRHVHLRLYEFNEAALELVNSLCEQNGQVSVRLEGWGSVRRKPGNLWFRNTRFTRGWRTVQCT